MVYLIETTEMIDFYKEKVQVSSKDDALRLHLMIKCFEKGVSLSDADISSLVELSQVGYSPEFYDSCVRKGYFKSNQTVRNAVGRMTAMGILTSPKRGERIVNPDYMPNTKSEKVMIQYLIGNLP